MYPSDKSYIKTNDWTQGKTDEFTYDEAKYEYSFQEEFQSMLFYYETYEYGELTERSVLSYGELGQKSNCMILELLEVCVVLVRVQFATCYKSFLKMRRLQPCEQRFERKNRFI